MQQLYLYSMYSLGTLSDNVGRFSEDGETLWFQQYVKAERNIANALMELSEDDDLTQEVKDKLVNWVPTKMYLDQTASVLQTSDKK